MKKVLGCLTIGAGLLLSTQVMAMGTYSGQVRIDGAIPGLSEFENDENTKQFVIEAEQGFRAGALDYAIRAHGRPYVIARYENNNHPVDNVDGSHVFLGAGFETYSGFGVTSMFSKDEYRLSPYYRTNIGDFEVKGEMVHRDRYSESMSITGLRSSVGYEITNNISLGASYKIRNVTERSTDDIFSLYAQLKW